MRIAGSKGRGVEPRPFSGVRFDANLRLNHHCVCVRCGKANDFFVNLLAPGTEWKPVSKEADMFEGRDRKTGKVKWIATSVDLIFGSNAQLQALAEVYACEDA